jgi:hypothetical protein
MLPLSSTRSPVRVLSLGRVYADYLLPTTDCPLPTIYYQLKTTRYIIAYEQY